MRFHNKKNDIHSHSAWRCLKQEVIAWRNKRGPCWNSNTQWSLLNPKKWGIANSWKGGKLKWFLANYKKIDGQRQSFVKNIWIWIFDIKSPVNWFRFAILTQKSMKLIWICVLTWKIKKIYLNFLFWHEKSSKLI